MTELTRTYKLTDSGAWGWVTEEAEGGGGGSLPSWWTVDSTPGSETATFAGALNIAPTGSDHNPLDVIIPEGSSKRIFFETFEGAAHRWEGLGNGEMRYRVYNVDGDKLYEVEGTGAVTISPTGSQSLLVKNDNGDTLLQMGSGTGATQFNLVSDFGDTFKIATIDSNITIFHVQSDGDTQADQKIGFFAANPVTQPTGVAVDAAGIHAALVSLGLIAA